MGTDIHGYIDYDVIAEESYCANFATVKLTRNYWLFSLLAQVRGASIQGVPGLLPKGLPKEISNEVRDNVYLKIVEDNDPIVDTGLGYCERSFAVARQWKIIDEYFCENPDFHSVSYVSLEELNDVLMKYSTLKEIVWVAVDKSNLLPDDKIECEIGDQVLVVRIQPVSIPFDFAAVYGSMVALKANGVEPRFVFFFDN